MVNVNEQREKQDIIGVDYIEVKNDYKSTKEESRSTADLEFDGIYYNAVQVAKILNEPDSVIRYWTREFDNLLNLNTINGNRKYTKVDISNLKFIQKLLRKDGFSIRQAYDYCKAKGFDSETGLIDESNHLAVKTLIRALTEEMEFKVDEMQKSIILRQEAYMNQMLNSLREGMAESNKELAITIDQVVSDKLESFKEEFIKEQELEKEATLKTMDMVSSLHSKMDARKNENENKSFFAKLFKK